MGKEQKNRRRQTALQKYIAFRGATNFRNRLICATLSGKAIRIDDIRPFDQNPGVRDYEASLLRLLEKITNGCIVKINATGTSLKYVPGLLTGGEFSHDTPVTRSIGYYLEVLVALAPFGKDPLSVSLTGITNDDQDLSVDIIRVVTLPLYKQFGFEADAVLKVKRRGLSPLGGGEVWFKVDGVAKALRPCTMVEQGKIKRIRGVAYTARCGPMLGNRVISGARGVLNDFIPDVYVHSDHCKGAEAGMSSGYGVTLVAESTTGVVLSTELTAQQGVLPEDVGQLAARRLLEEISRGGHVDTFHQSLVLLFMTLCPEDVSRCRLGPLSPHTIRCLREFREFFGVVFKIKPETDTNTILFSCLGSGYGNFSRKTI